MSAKQDVNKIILQKLEMIDADEKVKKFIEQALKFELRNWNQERVHHTKEYDRIITDILGR